MKWNSTITAIGSEALDPNDNIIILFDNKATDKLPRCCCFTKI